MDRETLKTALVDLLEQSTGERPATLSDEMDLKDGLNLDSLDMVSLVLEIENQLNIQIQAQELNSIATVGQLLDCLCVKQSALLRTAA